MATFERTTLFNQALALYSDKAGWFGGKNWTEARTAFQRIVEADVLDELHGAALCYLGDMCRTGGNKITKDEEQAAVLYLRAVGAQSSQAMIALGDMYRDRSGGLVGGYVQAEHLYLLALAHAHPEAAPRLKALRASVATRDELASLHKTISTAVAGVNIVERLSGKQEARIAALEARIQALEAQRVAVDTPPTTVDHSPILALEARVRALEVTLVAGDSPASGDHSPTSASRTGRRTRTKGMTSRRTPP